MRLRSCGVSPVSALGFVSVVLWVLVFVFLCVVLGFGFWVSGFGFRVWGFGFWVWGLGFRV